MRPTAVLCIAFGVALALLAPRAAEAQNLVMSGATLTNNVSGWDDSGMYFTATANVDLLSFRFENQGAADTVWLLNSARQIVQTIAIPGGQPNYTANVTWPLTAGQTYYLISDAPSNGRWVAYTSFPTANAHISVQGVWRNTASGNAYTSWWFHFRDITTGLSNAPPIADAGPPTGSYTGVEGSPVSLDGSASSDPDGTITFYEWDCTTDGSIDQSSASPVGSACVYPDDGSWTVSLTVTDDGGAQSTATATVTVANLPPAITSSPPLTATEGSPYTYAATGTDPGAADILSWSLPVAPTGMAVTPSGGVVSWTPGWLDAVAGSANVVLSLSDDDGASNQQTWTVAVAYLDADGDGMPDTWEGLNGLDATTAADAPLDPDGDGLSNLEEWLGGTDPNVFDGPSAPVLLRPVGGQEVATATPELVLANSTDPQDDVLTYDIEVYADASAQSLIALVTGLPEGTNILLMETPWVVAPALPENADAFWRARAADPFTSGAWSGLAPFFVNAVEEAPPTPVLQYPIGGETVAQHPARLSWSSGGADPDRDSVTWNITLFDEAGATEVTSVYGLVPTGGAQDAWLIDAPLVEDTRYAWTAQAEDEHGLTSAWAEGETFLYSLVDSTPSTPVWVAPLDGGAVGGTAPWLVVNESTDAELSPLIYDFEAAPTADFDDVVGGSVAGTGEGTASFALESIGAALEENTWAFARARADDGTSVSPWAAITFFVRGENDPPATPVLLMPEDRWETATRQPTFVIAHSEDPEGDEVVYEIIVAVDEGLSEIEAGALALLPGAGDQGGELQTSWTPESGLSGEFFWSARAVDPLGAASEWATPFRIHILPVITTDDTVGCACGSFTGRPSLPLGMLLLLAAGMIRGRRS